MDEEEDEVDIVQSAAKGRHLEGTTIDTSGFAPPTQHLLMVRLVPNFYAMLSGVVRDVVDSGVELQSDAKHDILGIEQGRTSQSHAIYTRIELRFFLYTVMLQLCKCAQKPEIDASLKNNHS